MNFPCSLSKDVSIHRMASIQQRSPFGGSRAAGESSIDQADRLMLSFSEPNCSTHFSATGHLSTVFCRQLFTRGEKGGGAVNLNLIR